MHETWELQHVLLGCLFFSAAAFLSEKQPGNLFSLTVLTFFSSPANPLKGREIKCTLLLKDPSVTERYNTIHRNNVPSQC